MSEIVLNWKVKDWKNVFYRVYKLENKIFKFCLKIKAPRRLVESQEVKEASTDG